MFYFDPTTIEAMARGRLSRRGQLINLDLNDYRMLTSEREVICAGRVKSEQVFQEFLLQLKTALYNAQSAVDEPAEVMVHLIAHPDADVTMDNYSALGRTLQELFGDEILVKIGFASDESLPMNHKDIMVFIAGN
jgi:cell division GTPase FtsZ